MTPRFRNSEKGNCIKGMLIGCVLTFVVICVVVLGSAYYMWNNAGTFFANLMTPVVEEALKNSELSEEDRKVVRDQFTRVTERLKAGDITEEQVVRFTDAMVQGRIFFIFVFEMVEKASIPASGLSQEEKDYAVLVVQSTKRGLVEELFTEDQKVYIEKAIPMTADANGNQQPVEKLTDEDLSSLVGDLEIVLEEAGIPVEAYQVDYASFVKKIVDEILGEESTTLEVTPADSAEEDSAEIESASEMIEFASPAEQ